MLHEPWKCLGKAWIELRRVDLFGDDLNDVCATAQLIAGGA
jgi:hypothetical protein